MAARKKRVLTPEEQLEAALVPESEWPYEVPENWCWVRIGDAAQYINGRAFKPTEWEDEGRVIIRIQNLTQSTTIVNRTTKTYEEKYLVRSGDLLFAWSASLGAHFWNGEDGWLNQHIFKVIPHEGVDKLYLYFYLVNVVDQLYAKTHGSGMVHITMKPFKATPMPLPPLHEQRRIASRIEWLFAKLDDAEAELREVIDGSEQRKASILHRAFNGELTRIWREKRGLSMDAWKKLELGTAFDIVGGIQKKPSRAPKDNPVPYLTVANVFRNRIDLTDIRYFEVFDGELEKLQLRDKDILVVEGNGSGNEIGRCAMWRGELPVCIHQNHIIRLRSLHDDYVPEFVLLYLNSPIGRQVMREKAVTTAGLYNLSTGKIRSISMRFPTRNEQLEIVKRLERAIEKENRCVADAMAVLESIAATKQALLSKALHGELGTNDPNEPSSKELLSSILSGNVS